jgi:HEAT repeat protein
LIELKNFLVGVLFAAMVPAVSLAEVAPPGTNKAPPVQAEAQELLDELFSHNEKRRINAAVRLGRYEHPRVVEGLKLAARRDSSDTVKRIAIKALGDMQAESAAGVIADAIVSEATAVQIEAIKAGVKLSSPAVNGVILDKLNSPNPFIRQEVVSVAENMKLEFLKEEGALEKIIKLADDTNAGVRIAACRFIGNKEIEEAVPELVKRLKSDSSELVRQAAAEALGEIGDRNSTRALKSALDQNSPMVRVAAALALAKLGSDAGLDEAITAIKSTDYKVRVKACKIIGMVGDESLKFLLREALDDYDSRVQRAARQAIRELEKRTK